MIAITALLPLLVGVPTLRFFLGQIEEVVDQLQSQRAFSLAHALAHMVSAALPYEKEPLILSSILRRFAKSEKGLLYVVVLSPKGEPIAAVHSRRYALDIQSFKGRTPDDFTLIEAALGQTEPEKGGATPATRRLRGALHDLFFLDDGLYYDEVAIPVADPPLGYIHFGLDITASRQMVHTQRMLMSVVLLMIVVAGPLLVVTMHRRPLGSSEQRSQQSEALLDISRTLLTADSLESVLHQIVFHVGDVLHNEQVCLLLMNQVSHRLEPKVCRGLEARFTEAVNDERVAEFLAYCMGQVRSLGYEEARKVSGWEAIEAAVGHPVRSFIASPLNVHAEPSREVRRTLGLLLLFRESGSCFSRDEIQYLETFSHLAALAIEYSSLLAQSTLIREIHHRVKNHLQDVANLLSLEMRRVPDEVARQPLENTLNRLKSMSVAYDLLARSEQHDLPGEHSEANLKEILEELSAKVWQSMVPSDKRVTIRVLGDDLYVPSRKAASAGMVVNELATNALKHGLASRASGEVEVTLRRQNGQALISVTDNGVGLPDEFNPRDHARLGLTIVQTLVERDLGGKLTLENCPATPDGGGTKALVSLQV